jgi:predicted nicotinamide N-methyase
MCIVEIMGKKIVELGAGCGLVGIVCSTALRASHVLMTDFDDEVLQLLRRNVNANGMDSAVSVAKLDWTAPLLDGLVGSFDVVVASDVVYNRSLVTAYFTTASKLLRPGGTLAMANGRARFSRNADICEVESLAAGLFQSTQSTMDDGNEIISVFIKR